VAVLAFANWNKSLLTSSYSFLAAKRCICYGKSVRPSVRPSHSGTVSKRGNAEGCGLHLGQPSVSSFLTPRMVDGDDFVRIKCECKEVDPL